ncbi:MAG: spermidine synthase [Nocardioides sp.]|nr:spermidine synthase [Nocardioides sp.]
MALRIEELDWAETPIGVISLRRRHEPVVGHDVFEVKIDDEFLMSSLFTVVETELAHLGLARVEGERLQVLVGGLGLGYTLRAALEDDRVEQVQVIEAVAAVIDWHRRDLLPDTVGLAADPRCDLQHGDFFAQVAAGATARATYDAVLLDIDHSPQHVLHPSHGAFYSTAGLRRLAARIVPGGIFGLWSDDPPDQVFEVALNEAFVGVESHVVTFANPITGGESASTVYLAQAPTS